MPLRLRVAGKLPSIPLLAVIGSRKPMSSSLVSTGWIVDAAVSSGWGVVSGGALGVDGVAHEACLQRSGVTMVVLGSGLLQAYPPEHANMFAKVVAGGGCLVSEYHDHAPPRPWRFPHRNRLISAFAHAVAVVQAGERSGSMSTARIAADHHGRPLMVVPGSVEDPSWKGSNRLIRDGAIVINDHLDVQAALALQHASAVADTCDDKESSDDHGK